MPNCKSKIALVYNVELLASAGPIYFWTFTLPVRLHPIDGAKLWQDLCRELKRSLGFYGVRVFELHPGGHGLHVHCATGDRFDVNHVRSICQRLGWGRINVEMWENEDKEKASSYLSKYLTKQQKMWQGMKLSGVRWWGVFGKTADRVRVKDVQSSSFRRAIWDLLPEFVVLAIMGIPEPEPALKNGTRRFNFCKMWIVNKIYFHNETLLECFNGVRETWGIRLRALSYDLNELRRGAAFISGCEIGRACA